MSYAHILGHITVDSQGVMILKSPPKIEPEFLTSIVLDYTSSRLPDRDRLQCDICKKLVTNRIEVKYVERFYYDFVLI